MSNQRKPLWKTNKEMPRRNKTLIIVFRGLKKSFHAMKSYSCKEDWEWDKDTVIKWCYYDEFLALESENKSQESQISRLEKQLETGKGLFLSLMRNYGILSCKAPATMTEMQARSKIAHKEGQDQWEKAISGVE